MCEEDTPLKTQYACHTHKRVYDHTHICSAHAHHTTGSRPPPPLWRRRAPHLPLTTLAIYYILGRPSKVNKQVSFDSAMLSSRSLAMSRVLAVRRSEQVLRVLRVYSSTTPYNAENCKISCRVLKYKLSLVSSTASWYCNC